MNIDRISNDVLIGHINLWNLLLKDEKEEYMELKEYGSTSRQVALLIGHKLAMLETEQIPQHEQQLVEMLLEANRRGITNVG